MAGGTGVLPFEITTIPIVLHKEPDFQDGEGDYENHPSMDTKYRSGFRVGGGIDQDIQKCPYGYSDTGAYVTFVYPNSPAEESGLQVNDKLVQVNGHDLQFATHKKIVEVIHRYPVLNMLIHRSARPPPSGHSSSRQSTTSPMSPTSQNGHYNPTGQSPFPTRSHYAPNPYPQYGGNYK